MKQIKNFKTFEKYNPEFSELVVKNIMSNNKENVELWETINDLISELKRLGMIEIVTDLERQLMNTQNELAVAINACLKSNKESDNLYKILDKLRKIKKDRTLNSETITYKVKNSIQASIVKDLVEKTPYNCLAKINALFVKIDCKKNSVEEIDLLLKELPFNTFKIS